MPAAVRLDADAVRDDAELLVDAVETGTCEAASLGSKGRGAGMGLNDTGTGNGALEFSAVEDAAGDCGLGSRHCCIAGGESMRSVAVGESAGAVEEFAELYGLLPLLPDCAWGEKAGCVICEAECDCGDKGAMYMSLSLSLERTIGPSLKNLCCCLPRAVASILAGGEVNTIG